MHQQSHTQAARTQPHILINMWSRTFSSPPLSPPNCGNILYQTIGWGWAKSCSVSLWAGHGRKSSRYSRRTAMRNRTAGASLSYLGSSLSATPLCIWNALFLQCFFSSRPCSLITGCVLGYWHALCAGWRPDWASRCWGRGAAHCEPPESAASPPHQFFLKAYSPMAPVHHTLLRSDRATSCSSADRHRIHLYLYTNYECEGLIA